MYRWTDKYACRGDALLHTINFGRPRYGYSLGEGLALVNNLALLHGERGRERDVSRCEHPNTVVRSNRRGFLKVTPRAIRNIARGLSLHFRTVNIRSIVVESEALIENTRG